MPKDDGSSQKVHVNELKNAIEASKGNRGGAGPAGIRLDKTKFIFMRPGQFPTSAYLSRQGGGGATVATTDKLIILGIWDKDAPTGDGKL